MANPSYSWVVHKFGGTSVGNAERYAGVVRILQAEDSAPNAPRAAVVVSAMKGTTDGLIDVVEAARKNDAKYLETLGGLKTRHFEALAELGLAELEPKLEKDFAELTEVLRGVWLARSASERIVELVSGYGEIWSAQILNACLSKAGTPSRYLDARTVLVVDSHEKWVSVRWDESKAKLDDFLRAGGPRETLVITGFVASTADGVPTTLKRNGSDYSGSIFGRLLEASAITIWTDVDGVLSADPRLVPDAVVLSEMSYKEVTELANFGAKVVHPATMEPAVQKGIPVWIRNTFNPSFPGTKIHANPKSGATVKGFSAIEKMALLNIEGTGLIGVSGIAERLFGALRAADISVVMISQASSEHSICIAIAEVHADRAREAVSKAFFAEIHQGLLDRIEITRGRSILAAVGDNMADQPGVAGKFFGALGRAGVSVDAIAQGSSERNISAVIDGAQTRRALRAVHSAFYLSAQTIGIGLIGTGLIGKEFMRQLRTELGELKTRFGIDVRIRGILNSKRMILDGRDERGIPSEAWEKFATAETGADYPKADLAAWIAHLAAGNLPHTVIIDATASGELLGNYATWLRGGMHLITPNKKANTQSFAEYRAIREAASASGRKFLYSTNVGAGLPMLQTLRELCQTGDRLHRLEGVFSGTLSYIFNSFDGKRPFSEIVKEAREKGYTEPDPRDDLSGTDVARKLVILAREAGGELELADIPVENLVPASLRALSLEDYLKRMAEGDAAMSAKIAAAAANGEVLRYVGQVDEKGAASVRLIAVPKTHPFANLSGADNIVSFRTARYDRQPLVIQGPGAGPAVTAAGVFADLLRLASTLGASR
jgi:aspartokinase/homoserine dehydrogenase 1